MSHHAGSPSPQPFIAKVTWFEDNASFGAYAQIVQNPEYRDNKNRTMLEMLPDLLSQRR